MGRTIYFGSGGLDDSLLEGKESLTSTVSHMENDDILQLAPGYEMVLDEVMILDKQISIVGNGSSKEKPTIILGKNSSVVVLSSFVTLSGILFIDRRTNCRTTPMFIVNSSCRSFVFTDNRIQYQKTFMKIHGDGFYLARNEVVYDPPAGEAHSSYHTGILVTGTAGVNAIRENIFSSPDNHLRPIYLSGEGSSTSFNGILSICDNTSGASSQSFVLMDDFTSNVPGNFFLDIRDNDCQSSKFLTLYPTNEHSMGVFGDILLTGNHLQTCLNGLVFIDNDIVDLARLKEVPSICVYENRIDKNYVALDRISIYREVLTARYGQTIPKHFLNAVTELVREPYAEVDVDKNIGEVLTLKHGCKINVTDKGMVIPVNNLSRNEYHLEAGYGILTIRQRNCHLLLNGCLHVPKTALENYSFPLSMYIRKILLNRGSKIQQIMYENRYIPKHIKILQGFFYVGESIQANENLYAQRIGETETFEIMGTEDFEPGRYLFGYQGVYTPDGGGRLMFSYQGTLGDSMGGMVLVVGVLAIAILLAIKMKRK